MTVKIDTCVNPCARTYHLREEVTAEQCARMLQIAGVQSALNAFRYEVMVVIGKAFAWEEVEPQVLAILGVREGDLLALDNKGFRERLGAIEA